MVPSFVDSAPALDPVSRFTSCLWAARLAETHRSWNAGDSTNLRVIEPVTVCNSAAMGAARNAARWGRAFFTRFSTLIWVMSWSLTWLATAS